MKLYALKWYNEEYLITDDDGTIPTFTSIKDAEAFAKEVCGEDNTAESLREPGWTKRPTPVLFGVNPNFRKAKGWKEIGYL